MVKVKYVDEYGDWFLSQPEEVQLKVDAGVRLLEAKGVNLRHPYSSGVSQSKYSAMRELRIQVKGDPYRVLYIFDPERSAVLLLGGNKVGDEKRWYTTNVPLADQRYELYLAELDTVE